MQRSQLLHELAGLITRIELPHPTRVAIDGLTNGEMKMRTLAKRFIAVFALLAALLAATDANRSLVRAERTTLKPALTQKEDPAKWQTVSLSGRGIKFRLPPDWKQEGPDQKSEHENFTIQDSGWVSPKLELVRIYVSSYPSGFRSLRNTVASRQEMVDEQFDRMVRSAYQEVKRLKVGGVEGAVGTLGANSGDESASRKGLTWRGYRIYQGVPQEVDINISGPGTKSNELLQTILGTFEIEQDKN